MIQSLNIKNFILIDELTIDFCSGYNVLTGETGAGKSIIINAIDIVLGSKTNKEVIKTGCDKAQIEITLKLTDDFDHSQLVENGIEAGYELIISREISASSTRSRINGVLVTQDFIKELRSQLIDIHTQHQNYNYIQPKTHIKLLDNFGTTEHKMLIDEFNSKYVEFLQVKKQLNEAIEGANATEQQIDFLKFQIQEIESASIEDVNEDEKLEQELEVLLNAEKLKELSYSSYWSLYGNDGNVVDALGSIKMELSKLSKLDESTTYIEEGLINCIENLKELSSQLRSYAENQEFDQQKIDETQERIDVLDKIKRKYGNTLETVLDTYEKLSSELNQIEFSQDNIIQLENTLREISKIVEELAQKLSVSRKKLANELSPMITSTLEQLELPKVQFSVDIQNCAICENGMDKVEFLISTNISEPLKPLAKVASGGEISRVMLAIKTIFAKADKTNTVIFDEIDTGISGKASQAVADAIVNLANHHQILLITHQPIIAAKAQKHFYVTKDQEEQTKVRVYDLKGENKIKAIALLASGDITDESMNFARGLVCTNV